MRRQAFKHQLSFVKSKRSSSSSSSSMNSLTPEQFKILVCSSPYAMDLEDLVKKHWGDHQSDQVNDFIHDVREFHNNLLTVSLNQEKTTTTTGIKNQNCEKCIHSIKIMESLKKEVDNLSLSLTRLRVGIETVQWAYSRNRPIIIQGDEIDETLAGIDEVDNITDDARQLLCLQKNGRFKNNFDIAEACNKCFGISQQLKEALKSIQHLLYQSNHLIMEFFQLCRELRSNGNCSVIENQFNNLLDEISKMSTYTNKLKKIMSAQNEEKEDEDTDNFSD